MSWVCGVVGSSALSRFCGNVSKVPLPWAVLEDGPELHIIGHLPERHGQASFRKDTGGDFLILIGSPLLLERGAFRIVKSADLPGILDEPDSILQGRLFGQYSVVRSIEGRIELFSDPNSLRSLWVWTEDRIGVVFASRLSHLSHILGGVRLDVNAFGSHWLSHCQLSEAPIFQRVHRLCGAEVLSFSRNRNSDSARISTATPQSPPWATRPDNAREPIFPIRDFLSNNEHRIQLALSGGQDSRLLFSVLYNTRGKDFNTFVFGNGDEPDTRTALEIAALHDVPCLLVQNASLLAPALDGRLELFGAAMYGTTPISTYAHMANYDRVFAEDASSIVVDGAFGEIAREVFFKKIEYLIRVSRLLGTRNSDRFVRALSVFRADIFNEGVLVGLENGFELDVENFIAQLLKPNRDRMENELAVKYKRRNFFGYDQAWIDQFGFNAMPFGQKPYIDAIRAAAPGDKKRYGNYRRMIRSFAPDASRIPLVKGSETYPFGLPSAMIPFYLRLANKSRRPNRSQTQRNSPLRELGDYILDLVQSSDTRSVGLYDIGKIDRLATRYFAGETRLERELDWFLSFELWRRGCSIS